MLLASLLERLWLGVSCQNARTTEDLKPEDFIYLFRVTTH